MLIAKQQYLYKINFTRKCIALTKKKIYPEENCRGVDKGQLGITSIGK